MLTNSLCANPPSKKKKSQDVKADGYLNLEKSKEEESEV